VGDAESSRGAEPEAPREAAHGGERLGRDLGGVEVQGLAQALDVAPDGTIAARSARSGSPPTARAAPPAAAGTGSAAVPPSTFSVSGCVCAVTTRPTALSAAREKLGHKDRTLAVSADVTDAESMAAAFDQASLAFGGIAVVVANAGIVRAGALGEMDPGEFRRVVEVNLTGVFLPLQQAARHLGRQGSGGSVIVVSTKNVFAPGEESGAYSASKAGAHQLGRVAALELARHGVRVNMLLPDAVFSEGDVPSHLWQSVVADRSRARGIDPASLPEHYRQRNLLRARITATQVGRAVVFFAAEQTPTTGAVLPIDGGLPGAFPG
jgi:NAD(P)-dependent dehydrogenase (short-subunit alcohol dehydrogenase family)